ncbi:hypothetical protein [Roseimicrobium gellanilyticum]|uniref:hypothetical protein n=1 Tax=Roseimicrobium gellanilyticum TaxID=748857 RepID=UPI0011BE4F51|nr:hypothetical protein [Roseimicrobium gellanilyticum]
MKSTAAIVAFLMTALLAGCDDPKKWNPPLPGAHEGSSVGDHARPPEKGSNPPDTPKATPPEAASPPPGGQTRPQVPTPPPAPPTTGSPKG